MRTRNSLTVNRKRTTPSGSYQELTFNLTPGVNVRHDSLEGRNYTVVPMVMITEGVHDGSNGPLYYPEEELAKTPAVWNHKPIVVYHPSEGRSACEVAVLDSSKVGIIMNTKYVSGKGTNPGRLKAEAWLDMDRLKRIDGRVANALANKSVLEVSTGLFMDFEETEGYFGKKEKFYETVARNYRPDHLAILPDQKGACSVADGAGLLRNSASKQPDLVRVEEGFAVYKVGGRLYKHPCSVDEGELVLNGKPSRIQRPKTKSGDLTMNKKQLVNALITNAALGFEEKDRKWLMGLNEKQLKKMLPEEAEEPTNNAGPEDEEDDETEDEDDDEKGVTENVSDDDDEEEVEKPVKNAKTKPQPKQGDKGGKKKVPVKNTRRQVEEQDETEEESDIVENRKSKPTRLSTEDYLATLPPSIRRVVSNALATEKNEKKRLIGIITANKANTFKKEFLLTKGVEELGALAKLAKASVVENDSHFTAMGDVVDNAESDDEEGLTLPAWDFSGNNGKKAREEAEVEA